MHVKGGTHGLFVDDKNNHLPGETSESCQKILTG